jgi:hypothetical protein
VWVTRVELDGDELELDGILADVTIRHGRGAIDDGPTASTLQLRLLEVTRHISSNFRVGVPIVVDADGTPRFTGTVTDATLNDDELRVIAAGPLSTLSSSWIGSAPWPAERWSDRVLRAFAEAGLSELLELQYVSGWDPVLVARGSVEEPPEPVDLYSYLQTLAGDLGAAIVDTPDGHVLVQEFAARSPASSGSLSWENTPPGLAWNEADPGCSWEEATTIGALDPSTPPTLPVLVVDPAEVAYAPIWEMTDGMENVVTVTYGADADELEVTVTEASSVALYGERPADIRTELQNGADATRRATEATGRRAFPRWTIPSASLLRGYELAVGQVVELSDFQPAAPHESWNPVLEGWTDAIDGDLWTTELALSDPLLSGIVLYWAATPADIAWVEVDPACAWNEATSVADLNPSTAWEVFYA